MKVLKLIIKLFAGKTWIMLLGIVLTILSFTSSLGLTTLASWFLASCFLFKSIDLNIFYPSSSIRGFAIARTFFKYIQRLVTHKATFDVLTKLRVQVFASILPVTIDLEKFAALKIKANQDYLGKSKSNKNVLISDNELFDRLIRDIDHLDGFYVNIVIPFLGCLLTFLGFTIGFSFINVPMALLSGGGLIVVTLVIPWIFYPLGKKITANVQQSGTKLRLAFLNYLELQFENLIFNKASQKEQHLKDLDTEFVRQQLESDKYANYTTMFMQIILGTLLVLALIGSQYLSVLQSPNLYVPALAVVYAFLIIAGIELIIPLAALFLNLGQVINSAENLQELLDNKEADKVAQYLIDVHNELPVEPVETTSLYPDLIVPEFLEKITSIGVSVKDLNFNYQDNKVIQNLSIDFAPGSLNLISGDSGRGKTTFLNCILGLETSYKGSITIHGYDKDKQEILAFEAKSGNHRQMCVYLSQRVHIFNDSLRDNLTIAREDASDQEIVEVLEAVELGHLATHLEQLLGNGGRSLSGGETRRLGIARVLLSNAKLIVLDEPTESIDSEIEKRVLDLIFAHAKKQQATVILVSHNKNGYSYCENIYHMEHQDNQSALVPQNSND